MEDAKDVAGGILKSCSRDVYEEMEQDQKKRSMEFDAIIADKQAELNNYKNEISFLREKIRVTLNKFDEILANSVK